MNYRPSKKLMGAWLFVDLCLLAAGGITLAFALMWRSPNLLRNLVINNSYLTVGFGLGIALLGTWAISIGAIIQPTHITIGLVILNWVLIVDALAVIITGTAIWFFTLQKRENYHQVWLDQSPSTRIAIQDQLQCCGYFNSTDNAAVGGSFCSNATLNTTSGCVDPFTGFADMTLNNIFSTIYGFTAILILLFLASLCVINKRTEGERFRKIDEKRGGRGFV